MKSGHLQTFKSFFPITGKCRNDRHTGLELLESKWQDWPCNSIACEVDHIDRNKAAESHLSCRNGFLEKWNAGRGGFTYDFNQDRLMNYQTTRFLQLIFASATWTTQRQTEIEKEHVTKKKVASLCIKNTGFSLHRLQESLIFSWYSP